MLWTRITLGGLPVDGLTARGALDAIDALVDARRGGFVVTPNVDHLVVARRDARLRDAYARASLSLADGMPLIWMARALGTPLPEKVSGSDLLGPLMARAATQHRRVFLLGGTPAVSATASDRLTHDYPGLTIAGRDCSIWSPEAGPAADAALVTAIRRAHTDLVIVALGSPKQEICMARIADAVAPAVLLGLGASLDFVAGAVRRAPAWMSAAGFEWLYRLAQEPGRLAHRYLVRDLAVVPLFATDLARRVVRGLPRRTALGEHA
jgi:N-acetylglucosaminyldiphosphoundecaprenol N-acetyl-beta-D-mannosaminyltransferase